MASKRTHTDKRKITFWKSDPPLTSKRVSIILSNRKDSEKLAKAVRALRHDGKASFKLSVETERKIEEAEKLQSA
ncbi:hypothetical protein L0P88_21670 [Muricauda sp. SCSIO 64092]|uniref:hypothetical protein n=1 Tax=Allomuricauda sp. SCSIO 64092 TaxID=2908842 RepID=UPI001FF0F40D|nr:hypothetical protein [Muricauda sp. SCSIO 64092]UOY06519.1 hypothetical protein L0P88_21670 [Muricauda sp. SCSIO 64092]